MPSSLQVTHQSLPVVGYENFYLISDHGEAWGLRYGRPLKPYWNGGHWQVKLSNGVDKPVAKYLHVVMLEAFVGPCPSSAHRGLHKDDDPHHNVIDNLYWGTMQTNALDRVRNGRDHNARKTDCKRGHALSGPNLAPWGRARTRVCLSCNRANTHARWLGIQGDEERIAKLADQKFALIMVGAG